MTIRLRLSTRRNDPDHLIPIGIATTAGHESTRREDLAEQRRLTSVERFAITQYRAQLRQDLQSSVREAPRLQTHRPADNAGIPR